MTRSNQMAVLYMSGWTLQMIGDKFGITKERVRQIISNIGITRIDGGAHTRTQKKRIAIQDSREDACQKHWGHSLLEHKHLLKMQGNPILAYRSQRKSAIRREICWDFKFSDWWCIWQKSGKWHLRGRAPLTKYVMARFGDIGPYAKNNVCIQLGIENLMDGHKNTAQRKKH